MTIGRSLARRLERLEAELTLRSDEHGLTIAVTSVGLPDEIVELRFTPPNGRRRLRQWLPHANGRPGKSKQ
jgi:hypothetical protein